MGLLRVVVVAVEGRLVDGVVAKEEVGVGEVGIGLGRLVAEEAHQGVDGHLRLGFVVLARGGGGGADGWAVGRRRVFKQTKIVIISSSGDIHKLQRT